MTNPNLKERTAQSDALVEAYLTELYEDTRHLTDAQGSINMSDCLMEFEIAIDVLRLAGRMSVKGYMHIDQLPSGSLVYTLTDWTKNWLTERFAHSYTEDGKIVYMCDYQRSAKQTAEAFHLRWKLQVLSDVISAPDSE